MRARGLGRAWRGLTFIMCCCTGLVLAVEAASTRTAPDGLDVGATGLFVFCPLCLVGVACLSRRSARQRLRIHTLEKAALVDALTGLANRRHFDERLSDELCRARAIGLPLSLLVLDIDHFKRVNDTHGHGVGDIVLKQVATLIATESRHLDTVCRVGGEEFAVIVPGLEGAFAAVSAERLRRAVADSVILIEGAEEVRVTVSLGLATLRPGETADLLFRRADIALYGAKHGGRDRVSVAA